MELQNKIPLRHYYRNIDDLILNQAHEKAEHYSRFLLEKYPKNVALYKLLGKNYLDTQKYDIAQMLFSKILEIDPDDFVSHIGISLIAESFGDLDTALKSMRRAYEIQPSNESLQNEVIRLIRLIDGFAPEKIRLTRGALIKMYARSKLTEQAIAEARLGIHESPDRVDFKIKLAEMLAADGKIEDAIEICTQILKTFPYCMPVLEILFTELSKSPDNQDIDIYKSRLSELDPYFQYMKPETESVLDIPDVAIMVEAGDVPNPTIENLGTYIQKEWESKSSPADREQQEPTDWQSIVSEAAENKGIGKPINETKFEIVKQTPNESDEMDVSSENNDGKRERFLKKLSRKTDDHDNTFDEEIPDWILSYGKLESQSSIEVENSQSLENPQTMHEEATFEEDGMTDHAVPVNPDVDLETIKSKSGDWKKLENEADNQKTLDDTQKIKILQKNPDKAYEQLLSALETDDIDFVILCIEYLYSKKAKTKESAAVIEKYLQDKPHVIELWLILVRLFKALDMNDEALSALESAQMNISI